MGQNEFGNGCMSLKAKIVTILVFMTVTLYLSIELCLFISDQYVFYSAVTEQGLPYLTRQERHKYRNLSSDDQAKLKVAQRKAATLESVTNAVRITLGLVSMLIIGYISDRYGRRVAVGILIFGESLHILIISLVVTMQLSVWIIIAGGFFEAFFGGGLLSLYSQVAAVMVDVTRLSYVNQIKSDNTISEEKTNQEIWLWFTVFESIALLCSSMGSPIGGTIIYRYGFNAAVITCVSLFVPSLILICILPEPRKAFNKATNVSEMMDGDSTNGAGVDGVEDDIRTIEIQQNWKKRFIIKLQALRHLDPILIMVIVIVILASISSMVDLQYIVIYLMGSPFLWNPQQVGIYIGVSDFISSSLGIAYTIIVVRLRQRRNSKKKRPVSEETLSSQTEIINDAPALSFIRHMKLLVFTLAGSLAMMTVNKVLMAVAYQFQTQKANIIVYAAAIPRLVKSLVAPIARSMFSICTPPGNQGMIQSFGGFIARIGILISLTALPALYAATVTVFPQAVFITVGAVMVITIIFDLCILPLLKSKRIQHSPNAKA